MKAKIERFQPEEEISIILFPETEQEFVATEKVRYQNVESDHKFHVFCSLPSGPGSRGVRLQIRKL